MKTIITITLIALQTVAFSFSSLDSTSNTQLANDSTLIVKQEFESINENDSINLFLLMGLTRESANWGPTFVENIKKKLPNARIYFLDLPGAGKNLNAKAGSIHEMVDFMRDDVKDVLLKKDRKNIICATSLAGMVATEWTISYKDDFQGLVVINSSFKGICKGNERVSFQAKLVMLKVMFARSNKKRESLIVTINSNKPETYDSVSTAWANIKEVRPMTKANMLRQTLAGMKYEPNGKPELPLLIIGSKGDRMVCTTCIEKTHDAFGGTLIWNETSGHGLPADEPVWLTDQITSWTNSLTSNELSLK